MSFQKIEEAIKGATCQCGGTVTTKNSLLLCSVCGYGASITVSLSNEMLVDDADQESFLTEAAEASTRTAFGAWLDPDLSYRDGAGGDE